MANPSLTRNKTGRRYVWPPNTPDPELVVPSVTTILNNLNKPALPAWAAKKVAEFAHDHLSSWGDLPREAAIDLLKRSPYRDMSGKGDVGTAVHEAVDNWIRANLDGTEWELDDIDLLPYVAGVHRFLSDHVHRVLHSEVTLFNRKYEYAGTADAICKLEDGRVAIVDWKTSKNVYPEHALQIVAYANSDFIGSDDGQEIDFPPIDIGYVIHLAGDANYKAYPVELTARAFKTFCALRSVQLWMDDYKDDALGQAVTGSDEEE